MKLEKVISLLHEVDRTGVSEFEMQDGEFRLFIKKGSAVTENTGAEDPGAEKEQDSTAVKNDEEISIQEGTIIRSPLVGIFHASDSQNGEPFVTVGTSVKEGQVLAAIEAMKMLNNVVAGCDGTVTEVLAKDGELVEYAQPLFVIEG